MKWNSITFILALALSNIGMGIPGPMEYSSCRYNDTQYGETVYFSEDCKTAWVLPPARGKLKVVSHSPNRSRLGLCPAIQEASKSKRGLCNSQVESDLKENSGSISSEYRELNDLLDTVEDRMNSSTSCSSVSSENQNNLDALSDQIDFLEGTPGAVLHFTLDTDWINLIHELKRKNPQVSFLPMGITGMKFLDADKSSWLSGIVDVEIPGLEAFGMEGSLNGKVKLSLEQACKLYDKGGHFTTTLDQMTSGVPINVQYQYTVKSPVAYKASMKGKDVFTNIDAQVQVTIFFVTITVHTSSNYRRVNESFTFEVTEPSPGMTQDDYLNFSNMAKINILTRYLKYASWYQSFHAPDLGDPDLNGESAFQLDKFLKGLCSQICSNGTDFARFLNGLVSDFSYLSSLINIGITANTVRFLDDHVFVHEVKRGHPIILTRTMTFVPQTEFGVSTNSSMEPRSR